MTALEVAVRRTFHSLRARNFRLYLFGQVVSVTGTWMQSVASVWLVLKMTGSGVDLGIVTALQFAPILFVGAWGGVIADRYDKRIVLIGTQTAFAVLALVLGVFTATGSITLAMVYWLSLGQGVVTAIDMPVRQSFVVEMVGPDDLTNAVSLNSAVMTGTRIAGPALAAILILAFGIAPVFFVNAVSYVAVIGALAAIRAADLHRENQPRRGPGALREGFHYVLTTPALRAPLALMAVLFTLSFNFSVLLPLLAKRTFHGGAGTFGSLLSVMGVGSFLGALVMAHRSKPSRRMMAVAALAFGVMSVAAAFAPNLGLEMVAMFLIGISSISFMVNGNSTLQLTSAPEMRGRVMALYGMVFLGTTPFGALLAGWVAERFGPRVGLGAGGAIAAAAAGVALWSLIRGAEGSADHEAVRAEAIAA